MSSSSNLWGDMIVAQFELISLRSEVVSSCYVQQRLTWYCSLQQVPSGCFLWEAIYPKEKSKPVVVFCKFASTRSDKLS